MSNAKLVQDSEENALSFLFQFFPLPWPGVSPAPKEIEKRTIVKTIGNKCALFWLRYSEIKSFMLLSVPRYNLFYASWGIRKQGHLPYISSVTQYLQLHVLHYYQHLNTFTPLISMITILWGYILWNWAERHFLVGVPVMLPSRFRICSCFLCLGEAVWWRLAGAFCCLDVGDTERVLWSRPGLGVFGVL